MYKDFKEQVKQMANSMLKPNKEYISIDYIHTLIDKLDGFKRKAKLHTFPCGAVLAYFYDLDTDRMYNSHSALEIEYEIDNWDRTFCGTTNWSDVNLFFQPSFDVLGFIYKNGEMLKSKNLEEMEGKFKGEDITVAEDKPKTSERTFDKVLKDLLNSTNLKSFTTPRPPFDLPVCNLTEEVLFLNLAKSSTKNGTEAQFKIKLNLSPETLEWIDEFYADGSEVQLSLYKEKIIAESTKKQQRV